ncbi:MAG: hypothetical protein IJ131_04250 [Eggerthellaceae bacterium]|nr:hypothetical protein [Eggerthellaceae bacterium]
MKHARLNNSHGSRDIAALGLAAVFLVCGCWATLSLWIGCGELYGMHFMEWCHHYAVADQYGYLADAFLHGRTWLALDVSPDLLSLDNPYKTSLRYEIGSESVPIYWDVAFFDGKYYSYFGALPALLLYAPYQLLTGAMLGTPAAVGVLCTLFIVGAVFLSWALVATYLPEGPRTGAMVLCLFAIVLGGNAMYLVTVPRFYSVPYLCSLALTCTGLAFWIRSSWNYSCGVAHLPRARLFLALGSLFIALNIASRPLFFFSVILAFPIFSKQIFGDRVIFARGCLADTLCALVPFFVVGFAQMAYNFVRFGGFFDFGSAYNLTGFDMVLYHQKWSNTLAIFQDYLCARPDLIPEFPFFLAVIDEYPNQFVPCEPYVAGFVFIVPVVLLALCLPFVAKRVGKSLVALSVLSLLLAFVLIVLDARTAGLSQRYFGDFGIFLIIPACMAIVGVYACLSKRGTAAVRVWTVVVLLFVALSLTISVLAILAPGRYDSLAGVNPNAYETLTASVRALGIPVHQ